jgi:hypothetical protein
MLQVASIQADPAMVRRGFSRQQPDQGGFSGAIRTEHRRQAAGTDRHRHLIDEKSPVPAQADAFSFDHDETLCR